MSIKNIPGKVRGPSGAEGWFRNWLIVVWRLIGAASSAGDPLLAVAVVGACLASAAAFC